MSQASTVSRISANVVGALGENRAVSGLLARGHRVALPIVQSDDPVDLIVNYRTLVQVKAAGAPLVSGGYKFRGPTPPELDVFMLYALDIDAWWIVPAEVIRPLPQRSFIVYLGPPTNVGGRGRPRSHDWEPFTQWREAWSLFDR